MFGRPVAHTFLARNPKMLSHAVWTKPCRGFGEQEECGLLKFSIGLAPPVIICCVKGYRGVGPGCAVAFDGSRAYSRDQGMNWLSFLRCCCVFKGRNRVQYILMPCLV